MIRTDGQYVWNVVFLMAFLTVGFSIGMLFGLLFPDTALGAFGRIFLHLDVGHIVRNIVMILLVGLVLSAYAHPIEFAGVFVVTVLFNIVVDLFWFSATGMSLLGYAAAAALIVYLIAVVFELTHFGAVSQVALLLLSVLFLAVTYTVLSDQLMHDFAVVFQGQPVQYGWDGYTRESSLAHVVGFCWGLVAAVGFRIVRYRLFDDHYDLFEIA